MGFGAQASLLVPFVFACACAHSPDGSRNAQTTTTGATSFTLPSLPGQSPKPPGTGVDPFTPSSPELDDPGHPANRLGTAACERKQECDEIGDGRFYASSQACLTSTRRHAHDDLDRLSCENGLDDKALDACVTAVRRAACAALASLASVDACNEQHLCAR